MAKVRVTHSIRIGRRTLPVKKVPQLGPLVARSMVQATAPQLRVLAEESRELIRDRLFAAVPQAPGRVVVARPPISRAPNIPPVTRNAARLQRLSRRAVRTKVRRGEDGRILIATGDAFANGIEVFQGKQASGVYYMVRPEQRTHLPSGMQLSALFKLHEKGSARRKIPARPVWGPALRQIIAMFRAQRERIRAEALRLVLRQVQ
jgi:hypothetical protein